jgi:hypothetical protein
MHAITNAIYLEWECSTRNRLFRGSAWGGGCSIGRSQDGSHKLVVDVEVELAETVDRPGIPLRLRDLPFQRLRPAQGQQRNATRVT